MKLSKSGMPPAARAMGAKPHIRMRKMKPVAASAFPVGPAAFPAGGPQGAPDPGAALAAQPNGMGSGANPGDSGP